MFARVLIFCAPGIAFLFSYNRLASGFAEGKTLPPLEGVFLVFIGAAFLSFWGKKFASGGELLESMVAYALASIMDAALLGMILAYVCALQINPLDGEMRSLACLFLLGFFLFESLLCIQYASQANNLIDSQQEMHPWWRR